MLIVRLFAARKNFLPAVCLCCACTARNSTQTLLNYFRRKDVKDKGHFLPEPGGELPKEVVESTNFYTRPGCECH